MNSAFKTITAIVIITVCTTTQLSAQLKSSDYEVGINAGTLIYQGDLIRSPFGSLKPFHLAVGFNVKKKLDNYFSVRGNLTFGKISANEADYTSPYWKQYRNFAFTSSITELTGHLMYNILGENSDNNYHTFSPYVFAGAGFSVLNVKRDWSKFDSNFFGSKSDATIGLGKDSIHSTPTILPVIPVGLGVAYQLSNRLSVNAEATYRFTFSDYIDGFSYAANPTTKDAYYGVSIGISYKLGNNITSCPRVRR